MPLSGVINPKLAIEMNWRKGFRFIHARRKAGFRTLTGMAMRAVGVPGASSASRDRLHSECAMIPSADRAVRKFSGN